jgi:hypothetical protein
LLTALVKHQGEGHGGDRGRKEAIMEWTQIDHFAKIYPADTRAADLYVAQCLAAANGHEAAAWCRADVSDEMTAREIAEAQRRAREWLAAEARRAA